MLSRCPALVWQHFQTEFGTIVYLLSPHRTVFSSNLLTAPLAPCPFASPHMAGGCWPSAGVRHLAFHSLGTVSLSPTTSSSLLNNLQSAASLRFRISAHQVSGLPPPFMAAPPSSIPLPPYRCAVPTCVLQALAPSPLPQI
eukprot:EG_transcript_19578